MQKQIIVVNKDCPALLVPDGISITIKKDTFVTLTQSLGGAYTVLVNGNMARVDGTDADAIGRKPQKLDFPILNDGLIHEEHVFQALATIYDPEIPIDLLSLGLIYKVSANQDTKTVHIDMTLTAPACGMGPVLVGDVECRVSMVPNVKKVAVELIFEPPWSREMMSEEAQLEAGIFF